MPENHQSQKLARKIVAGTFIVTGFAALNSSNGLVSQLAKSLDEYLLPVAQANVANSTLIAQSPEEFISLPQEYTLYIESNKATVVNNVGEQNAAPDGYYQLSNGIILKIESGILTYSSSPEFDPKIATDVKWKDWPNQSNRSKNHKQMFMSESNGIKSNVKNTLNKIVNS